MRSLLQSQNLIMVRGVRLTGHLGMWKLIAGYHHHTMNSLLQNQNLVMMRGVRVKAPIDVQGDVSGSVLIPISVLPTHVQFHFNCFKSRYRVDMASLLSDAEISHVYIMNTKRNRM